MWRARPYNVWSGWKKSVFSLAEAADGLCNITLYCIFTILIVLWWEVREKKMQMKQAIKIQGQRCWFRHNLGFFLFSVILFLLYFFLFFFASSDHKEGADWRKTVPSYTQSSSMMDYRTWSSLPRDDSLEPLPFNWEMAYTETGMVYFIE